MEKMIKSIAELEQFSRSFLDGLRTKEGCATTVGLSGDLGSGKTAFTKATAKTLGVIGEVLSPTFVIAKFYEIPEHPSWSHLVHVDAYRIGDPDELSVLRWGEILADRKNLVLIEWPEHVGAAFPSDAPVLTFRFVDEMTRSIS
ncbi:MAG TPA: tRNA (adenosine(37)-N6)-threonylcarbamoyltransferase complex ATPase subunit type 1 TsaE [Candidatus Paceibacterota bacterium]